MSWKGIKRAAARTPHLMMGNKSNDAIFESLEKEFTSAIAAVDKIINEAKNFRDSWTRILTHQLEMPKQWTQVYQPIPGEGRTSRVTYYETPQSTLQSIESYTNVLSEVKETLLPILNGMDGKVVTPSMDMKKALEGIAKMVKKRHHKKMDYDRFTASVEKLKNKKDKTEKDQVMLQKMENELEIATQEFNMHDEKMKDLIPSIMDAISAFFTPMLNTMYAIQADLFQHLYASVYEYATSQGLTNTENLVEECNALYEPMRQRAETEIKSLREGKVARTPFGETGKPGMFARKSSSSTATTSRPSGSKPTSPASPPPYTQQPEVRRPSGSFAKPPPPPAPPSGPSPLLTPGNGRNGSSYGNSRTPSSSSINSDAAKKKKPPPPPPPKPSVSPKPEFVVAKYEFAGQSQGDLAFKVGDRIKIIKKTESTEDWWEGELNGSRGMFPRNYCD